MASRQIYFLLFVCVSASAVFRLHNQIYYVVDFSWQAEFYLPTTPQNRPVDGNVLRVPNGNPDSNDTNGRAANPRSDAPNDTNVRAASPRSDASISPDTTVSGAIKNAHSDSNVSNITVATRTNLTPSKNVSAATSPGLTLISNKENPEIAREHNLSGHTVLKSFAPILADVDAFQRDLDIRPGRDLKCGYTKCWVSSKSHPGYGYTIGQSRKGYSIDAMTLTWEYAGMLQEKYGVGHLYHGYPPHVFLKTPSLGELLNNALLTSGNKTMTQLYTHHKGYYVQVMRSMPKGSLIFLPMWNRKSFREKILSILPGWVQKNVQNGTDFSENLGRHFNQTKQLIEREPKILRDFQLIVDPSGRVIHFDLDRIASEGFPSRPKKMVERLEVFQHNATALALAKDTSSKNRSK